MFRKCFISIGLLAIFVNLMKCEYSSKVSAENKSESKRYVFLNYWNTKAYKNRMLHDKFQRLQWKKENEKQKEHEKLKERLLLIEQQEQKEKLQKKLLDQKEEIKTKIFKERLLPLTAGSFYKDFLTMRY